MYYSTTEYGKTILHDFFGGHQIFNPYMFGESRYVFFEYETKDLAAKHAFELLQKMSLLEDKGIGEKHHFTLLF